MEGSLENLRKVIILEVYNKAAHFTLAYKIHRCWSSEFQAMPALDANANEVAVEYIRLENEGWERDYGLTEPSKQAL